MPRVRGPVGGRQQCADVARDPRRHQEAHPAGENDEEIRQAYVDRYGEQILLQPQGSGISLLVWVLPVVVLVVGAFGIGFVLARNRRTPMLHASEADEQLVERAREQQQ